MIPPPRFLLPLVCVFEFLLPEGLGAQSFLSSLSANPGQPLYLSYAAATARSSFMLDQGYQFHCYDPAGPLSFTTSGGGSLTTAFKLNDSVFSTVGDCFKAPVITTSYSDLVRTTYFPFDGIRVEASFIVYSSRIAVEELRIVNERLTGATLHVYPYTANTTDRFASGTALEGGRGFSYRHSHPPDGWVIDHAIPYVADRADVFLMDSAGASYGGYLDPGQPGAPRPARSLARTNFCVEYGLVYHSDGSPCTEQAVDVRQTVYLHKSTREILTENAPKWGDADPNIPGNGYQGCELGNFAATPIAVGDTFSVVFSCETRHEVGRGTGTITQLPATGGISLGIQLHPASIPTPTGVTAQFSPLHDAALLQWHVDSGVEYSLYRRPAATPGVFSLIASHLQAGSVNDAGLDTAQTYAYAVSPSSPSGEIGGHSVEAGIGSTTLLQDVRNPTLVNAIPHGPVSALAMHRVLTLGPGASQTIRLAAGVAAVDSSLETLLTQCKQALTLDFDACVSADEQAYAAIPDLSFGSEDVRLLYWSAFSLLRQCMLPPEGACHYPYYVFSREPQWGWGHGGQVFHESLSMLAYGIMDPEGAQNSQRVFRERQHPDGYINYRTGPYLDETIETNGQLTTSAPWYSWINLELYHTTHDRVFLEEMYSSGSKLFGFFAANRDADHDGLFEWGGHAVLESVRDGEVAVWDNVGWPALFDCLDLSAILYNEARSLAEMAGELGLISDQGQWTARAEALRDSINTRMWDPSTGFYYHVVKTTHSFSYASTDDLKRKEIIGFLPLWAGIARSDQAAALVQHLTDSTEFWRPFGVPSLAANDPYYNPQGYWNGPVWVQWQYLIFRGLLRYGYVNEAKQLADRVTQNMISSLKNNHWFWELYSPDSHWSGWNKTYIWAGIAARMLCDLNSVNAGVGERVRAEGARTCGLDQNYPNPFNPRTAIRYSVGNRVLTTITVVDVLGREITTIVHAVREPGTYTATWNASGCPSGVYFCTMRAGEFVQTRKMMVVR